MCRDAFGQRRDVRDDADVFAVGAQGAQGVEGAFQGFFVEGAEAFVEEEGVDADVFPRHVREAEGEGEADEEGFAAGEVFGGAGFAALVVVDDVGLCRGRRGRGGGR